MESTRLPPLDRVDPSRAWEPWRPDAQNPWNLRWAGHLYRRAGFGASREELHTAVRNGLPVVLERLLQGPPQAEERYRALIKIGEPIARRGDPYALRAWWVYCLFYTPHPLREKMTLFWHNHFATSIAKVQSTELMFHQNERLRRHALGKFRPFLLEMSQDPAMLIWLDSNSNVKGKPNENYAREVMELFSLGVGKYTETDIREAARAFTGWRVEDDHFAFDKNLHDEGAKIILGQKGSWNGDDVVRIVLEQPAAARFLVRKLYRYFISEAQDPPDVLIEPLADGFRKSDYDIAALMKTMLSSRHFFSDYAYLQRVKDPVEFVIGAIRSVVQGAIPIGSLPLQMDSMGMDLFSPPNVKGWRGGKNWLSTATVLARQNFTQRVASATLSRYERRVSRVGFGRPSDVLVEGKGQGPDPHLDVVRLIRNENSTTPAAVVGFLVDTFLPGGVPESVSDKLSAFLAKGDSRGDAFDNRIRETAHALTALPEYQLA